MNRLKGDLYTGNLILVNGLHPLNRAWEEPVCISADDTYPHVLLDIKAASCLRRLLHDIDGEGKIVPVSGYRSHREQAQLYADSLLENGEDFTNKYVAKPGCSEHETGLAIDLAKSAEVIDFICPDFPYDGICGDFRRQASRYGFVQRYQEGKEDITGIACEPWHFRYVGYPHSVIMEREGMCLEEYVEYLKNFTVDSPLLFNDAGRTIRIAYVTEDDSKPEISKTAVCQLSGSNTNGRIATLWD